MQVDYGSLAAAVAGRGPGPEPPAPRRSRSRRCVATGCEGAGRFCEGLVEIPGLVGGVPRAVAPGDATEAGRMPLGRAAESRPSPQTRARCRLGPRFRDPHSGNERGSVGDAVGLPRGNLLVPVPSVASAAGPDARLRIGCERTDPASRNRSGEPATRTLPVDFAATVSLPGVRFDSVRWLGARSDERGHVRAGGDPCCAGPAWHDRGLVVGVRANGVSMLADRSRRVATLPGCRGGGPIGGPPSLVPAIVARPRATVEPAMRRDMPDDLVAATDAAAGHGRARPRGPSGGPPPPLGPGPPARRRGGTLDGGRVPDDASRDVPARRVAAGERDGGGAGPTAYDRLVGEGARLRVA